MNIYEDSIDEAFERVKKEFPALVNTAADSAEGRRILLNVLHREANMDKLMIIKWINSNTELKYEIRHKTNS